MAEEAEQQYLVSAANKQHEEEKKVGTVMKGLTAF